MEEWARSAGRMLLVPRQGRQDNIDEISGSTEDIYRFVNASLKDMDLQGAGIENPEQLINDLFLNKVSAVRQMNIILGAIGMFCSLLTIIRIINDAQRLKATQVKLRPKRFDSLLNVHPAETFPFVLAKNMIITLGVFIGVQATALNTVTVTGCSRMSQLALPAIFLIGYSTLVFGFETAIRGLNTKECFKPRGNSNSIWCVVIIMFLTIATWIPTAVRRSPNRCYGSLVWFAESHSTIAIAIIFILIVFYNILALTIMVRLKRVANIDPKERVSASWMVYYLYSTMVIYIFTLPFFVNGFTKSAESKFTAARVADVPLYSAGLILSFLHAFLRSNAQRLLFMPAGMTPWEDGEKPRIRLFGNSDLDPKISGPSISKPDSGALIFLDPEQSISPEDGDLAFYMAQKAKLDSDSIRSSDESERANMFNEVNYSKPRQISKKSYRSSILDPTSWRFSGRKSSAAVDPSMWPLPPHEQGAKQSVVAMPKRKGHKRNKSSKSNYTLFPTRAENLSRLPSTYSRGRRATMSSTYDAVSPYPISTPRAPGMHRRDSSVHSSATVQIGLRLSIPAPPPPNTLPSMAYQPPLPQTTYNPSALAANQPSLPQSTYQPPTRQNSRPQRPVRPEEQSSPRQDLPLRQDSKGDEILMRQSLPVGQGLPIQLEAFTPVSEAQYVATEHPPMPEPRVKRQPTLSSLIREEKLDQHSVKYMRRESDFDDRVDLPQPLNVPSRQNSPRPSTADSNAVPNSSAALNFGFAFPGGNASPSAQVSPLPGSPQTLLPSTTYSPTPSSSRSNGTFSASSKRPDSSVLRSPASFVSESEQSTIGPLPTRTFVNCKAAAPPQAQGPSAFPLPDYPDRASFIVDPTAPLPAPRPTRSSSVPMSPAAFSGLRMNPATEFIAGPDSPFSQASQAGSEARVIKPQTATALTIGTVASANVVTVSNRTSQAGPAPVVRSTSEKIVPGGSRLGLGKGTIKRKDISAPQPAPGWI